MLDIGFNGFGTGAEVGEILDYLPPLDLGNDHNTSGNEIFVPLLGRFNEITAMQADTIERALQPRCAAALVETVDPDEANTDPGLLHAI